MATPVPPGKQWRTIAAGAAVILAVAEVVISIGNEVAWVGFAFAALFAAGAYLIFRDVAGPWGLYLVAVLFAVEVAFVPVEGRDNLADWIVQGAVALVSACGLVAAVVALFARHRSSAVR